MAGIRYASVLPMPVPASIARILPGSVNALVTAMAISIWPDLNSKPLSFLAKRPSAPNISSIAGCSLFFNGFVDMINFIQLWFGSC